MEASKLLFDGFVKEIRRLVGDSLALMPSENSTRIPAVIKDRTKGIKNAYPFIVVEIDSAIPVTPFIKDSYFDEQTDQQVYIIEQIIPIRVTCYGKGGLGILTELDIRTNFDVDRHKLNFETKAVFNRFSQIDSTPAFLSTDYVEAASTTAIFTVVIEYRPSYDDAKDIIRVIANGEFYDLEDKSDEPIQVVIDETSQTS